jgi:ATP-dependent Clp protease ATP-binding subunit ClpC
MWKQLTQKARKAIFLAQEEAGRLGYSHVGPEHLLLALAREEDCMAVRILEGLGIDPGTVRVKVMKELSRGSEVLGQEMALTTEAKSVIDLAFAESRDMKEEWVGTEHLLIGILRSSESTAAKVLTELGVDLVRARTQVRSLKAGTLNMEGPGETGSVSVSTV